MSQCRASSTLDTENQQQTMTLAAPKRDFLQEACCWTVENEWVAPAISVNNNRFGAWGLTLSRALMEWLQAIKWPSEASEPDNVGITWLEMVAIFCQWTGMLFPVKRMERDDKFYLQVIADHAEANLHNVQWSEMAK